MGARNRLGQKVHTKMLLSSTRDTIEFSAAIEERYIKLTHDHLRLKGEELVFPPELDADVLRWRQMVVRHRSRDYRNTEDEVKSMQRIANWTLKIRCELTGNKYEPIDFDTPGKRIHYG